MGQVILIQKAEHNRDLKKSERARMQLAVTLRELQRWGRKAGNKSPLLCRLFPSHSLAHRQEHKALTSVTTKDLFRLRMLFSQMVKWKEFWTEVHDWLTSPDTSILVDLENTMKTFWLHFLIYKRMGKSTTSPSILVIIPIPLA